MADVCRFKFKDGINSDLIESKIALAILAAEGVFGRAKVRLDAAYIVSKNKAVIDVSSEVGEHIAQVFTSFMTEAVGEKKFIVERVRAKDSGGAG
ncbi:hypothetical protein HZB07_02850 [Candidatus Saganbacteria bacterium]|nr:hypothetical protein [Candidatus Saganbacteria bacterium]